MFAPWPFDKLRLRARRAFSRTISGSWSSYQRPWLEPTLWPNVWKSWQCGQYQGIESMNTYNNHIYIYLQIKINQSKPFPFDSLGIGCGYRLSWLSIGYIPFLTPVLWRRIGLNASVRTLTPGAWCFQHLDHGRELYQGITKSNYIIHQHMQGPIQY